MPRHKLREKHILAYPDATSARRSIHWALVVQSQVDTAVEQGQLARRLEHLASGQAAIFQSLEALLAFIARVLRAEHKRSTDQRA